MLTGLDHGAKLVTLPRFESESFLKSVHQHRVLYYSLKFNVKSKF
jgi:hypothetical protein